MQIIAFMLSPAPYAYVYLRVVNIASIQAVLQRFEVVPAGCSRLDADVQGLGLLLGSKQTADNIVGVCKHDINQKLKKQHSQVSS